MEYYHAVLFLLACAIAISALSPKIKIPYPVLLMLAGIAIGFIPGLTYVPVQPDIVFLMFLPPLLYDSAVKISFSDFRWDVGTISMLAVSMVFITMAAIALTIKLLMPEISWPVAFITGAILSPPDAVAASGIIKDMKLPHRTKTILEGESLVNDASALTAYRMFIGVLAGGSFVIWEAGLEFIAIIAGGTVVGMTMGWLFSEFFKRIPLASTPAISLNILLPFVAYQLAESVGVSGVLAVVAMGLLISKKIHEGKLFSVETVNQSQSVWNIIIYILSALVFILIGLELPQALHEIPASSILPLTVSAVAIFMMALFIRIVFIFEHRYRQTRFGKQTMDWKNALVVGWSGMRGIVSVATAIGLPVVFADGSSFTERSNIIYITVLVVILMLLIQGMGLPLLIKALKLNVKQSIREI